MEGKPNNNPERGRQILMIVGLVAIVLAAGAYVFLGPKDDKGPPVVQGKGIYYTGPMKSKTAGSNDYGTIDGRKLTEAEAKAEEKKWLDAHPEVTGAGKN